MNVSDFVTSINDVLDSNPNSYNIIKGDRFNLHEERRPMCNISSRFHSSSNNDITTRTSECSCEKNNRECTYMLDKMQNLYHSLNHQKVFNCNKQNKTIIVLTCIIVILVLLIIKLLCKD
jgi:Leu/Phe-tRNA-protein transferase